jgi:glycerate-2-kinase
MAGGLTDSKTYAASVAAGIHLRQALKEHATSEALLALSDCVYTGNTGTNLCDFNVLYIPGDDPGSDTKKEKGES